MSLLARAVFYPTLFYNVVKEKLGIVRWYDQIDDNVILGALPFKSQTGQLVNSEQITGVISLNEDYERKMFCNTSEEWQAIGIEHLILPTVDLTVCPSQAHLHLGVDFIHHHRVKGGRVYVHCKAGRSRSATLVACYLMERHKWTPQEAISYMKEKRPHVAIRGPHMKGLIEYYDQLQISQQ